MNPDQLSNMVFEHTKEIEALKGSVKTAYRRMDDLDKVTNGIHELAKNVAAMTAEIKLLTARVDKDLGEIKQGQKAQGERIGAIEREIQQIGRNEKEITDLSDKIDDLRMEPGNKWKAVVLEVVKWLVIGGLGFLLAGHLLNMY